MNKQSTFNMSSLESNSTSTYSSSLQCYFETLLRDRNERSYFSALPSNSSSEESTKSYSSNLKKQETEPQENEKIFLSCGNINVFPDNAKSHLTDRAVEMLRTKVKKISSAPRLDRWDCDEQNQIPIQQTMTPINITPTQQQQLQLQQQKVVKTETGYTNKLQQREQQPTPRTPSPNSSKRLIQKPIRMPSITLAKGENFVIVQDNASTIASSDTYASSYVKKSPLSLSPSAHPYSRSSISTSIMETPKCVISNDDNQWRLPQHDARISPNTRNSDSPECKTPMRMKAGSALCATSPTSVIVTGTQEENSWFAASESSKIDTFKTSERLPSRWGERDLQMSPDEHDNNNWMNEEYRMEDKRYKAKESTSNLSHNQERPSVRHQQPGVRGYSPPPRRNTSLVCPTRRSSIDYP